MGELDVRATDDADLLDDPECLLLEALNEVLADREHWGGAEGVAGVDADGVDVLDRADAYHLVLGVADDLVLKLLPALDGLLYEDLAGHRHGESARGDRLELLHVVGEAAAGAAHCVGGANDDGEAYRLDEIHGFGEGIGYAGARRVDAERGHRLLEDLAVLAALDGVEVDADDLDAVLVEDACPVERHGHVQTSLAA